MRDLIFTAANYAAGQTTDASGTPFTNTSTDPIAIIESAKDGMIVTPNQCTLGRDVYSALRKNPNVVKAVHGNDGDKGIASMSQLEDLFEMKFIIGHAIWDTAKPGQAVSWDRIWKSHMALQFIDESASVEEASLTHGFIAHYDNVGAEIPDPLRGIKGGTTVRAGHQRTEILASDLCGHLIEDAA